MESDRTDVTNTDEVPGLRRSCETVDTRLGEGKETPVGDAQVRTGTPTRPVGTSRTHPWPGKGRLRRTGQVGSGLGSETAGSLVSSTTCTLRRLRDHCLRVPNPDDLDRRPQVPLGRRPCSTTLEQFHYDWDPPSRPSKDLRVSKTKIDLLFAIVPLVVSSPGSSERFDDR